MMTRSELILKLMTRFGHLTRAESQLVVDVFFETIAQNLELGNDITIRGLGTFYNKQRRANLARNPRNGVKVHVVAKRLPAFKSGKKLISRMNKNIKS